MWNIARIIYVVGYGYVRMCARACLCEQVCVCMENHQLGTESRSQHVNVHVNGTAGRATRMDGFPGQQFLDLLSWGLSSPPSATASCCQACCPALNIIAAVQICSQSIIFAKCVLTPAVLLWPQEQGLPSDRMHHVWYSVVAAHPMAV